MFAVKQISRNALLLPLALLLATPAVQAAKKPRKSKKDELVTISTSLGDIRLVLSELTPIHRANFLNLARNGFYNGTTFHRVILNFMVQGGDPNSKDADPSNDGKGAANEPTLPAEIRPELTHKRGAVAAARSPDFVNPERRSSPSQFYIVQNPQGTPHLDGQYTVFGQVVSGQDVVDKIAQQPTGPANRPTTDIRMTVKVEKLKKKKITKEFGYQY